VDEAKAGQGHKRGYVALRPGAELQLTVDTRVGCLTLAGMAGVAARPPTRPPARPPAQVVYNCKAWALIAWANAWAQRSPSTFQSEQLPGRSFGLPSQVSNDERMAHLMADANAQSQVVEALPVSVWLAYLKSYHGMGQALVRWAGAGRAGGRQLAAQGRACSCAARGHVAGPPLHRLPCGAPPSGPPACLAAALRAPPPWRRRCTSGCSCNETRLEGHHEARQSQTFLLRLQATQDERCTITVKVEAGSGSGGNKVKVGGRGGGGLLPPDPPAVAAALAHVPSPGAGPAGAGSASPGMRQTSAKTNRDQTRPDQPPAPDPPPSPTPWRRSPA
jgi:hypothetical protein